jgi:hypothetical protein
MGNAGPLAGQVIGLFMLAGHGAGFTNSASDISTFNNLFVNQACYYIPGISQAQLNAILGNFT